MKLFKLMATTAITTMAVAAMSVSASAMTATYTAPVGDAAGSVTLSDIATTAEQKTLLILNKDAENVVEADIVQIDQDAALKSVAVGDLAAAIDAANQTALDAYAESAQDKAAYEVLTAAWTASTDYFVRVGGDGSIERYTLTVNTTKTLPEAPEEVPPTPTYTLGDVNVDTYINMGDAAAILNHYMGDALITDETAKLAADVNVDTYINMGDAAAILNHYMGDALIVQPQ